MVIRPYLFGGRSAPDEIMLIIGGRAGNSSGMVIKIGCHPDNNTIQPIFSMRMAHTFSSGIWAMGSRLLPLVSTFAAAYPPRVAVFKF
jgi:hypothetical protein